MAEIAKDHVHDTFDDPHNRQTYALVVAIEKLNERIESLERAVP